MGTVSTIPLVKAQIVSQLRTALATASSSGGQIQTEFAWPGPKTENESVFLGRHPGDETGIDAEHRIPNIKAGRKQRQESYTVPISVWIFGQAQLPSEAQACEARAFEVFELIEDMFAEDPLIGLTAQDIQYATVAGMTPHLWPFETGWACELVVNVEVQARLT